MSRFMFSNQPNQPLKAKLRLIQWFAIAMLLGVGIFTGLISVMADWNHLNENLKLLNLLAAGTGIFLFMLSAFAAKAFSSPSQPKQPGSKATPLDSPAALQAASALFMEIVLCYCLINGGIFLNLMVFVVEPHLVSFVIAAAGILVMLLFFPRQSRMISKIERQIDS